MGFYIEELPTELNGITMKEAVYWADIYLQDNLCDRMWDAMRALRDFYETVTSEAVEVADRKTEPSFKVDGIGDDDSTIHAIAHLQKVGWLQEHDRALTEPQNDLLVTEYPQDGGVNLIGRDKTEAVVMAYDTYKKLTEAQTMCYLRTSCDHYGDKQVCGRCREYNLYSHTKFEPQIDCPKTCPSIDICTKDDTDCAWKKG